MVWGVRALCRPRAPRAFRSPWLRSEAGHDTSTNPRLEPGRPAPHFDTIERVASALGLDAPTLLAAEPPVPPTPERARVLAGMKAMTARMSDAELERVERLIKAMEG